MHERTKTAVVGLLLAAVILFFSNTIVLNITVAILSVLAVWELFKAVSLTRHKFLTAFSLLCAVLIPFIKVANYKNALLLGSYLYILVAFCALIKNHATLKAEYVGFAFLVTIFLPLAFSTLIYIRDVYGFAVGMFYLLYGLVAAWMADIGGLFAGMFFGKRKLAPNISPKKTVEGAIGGLLLAFVSVLLFSFLFEKFAPQVFGGSYSINYLAVILSSPLFTVVSILGDLSASVIKRQHDVKDYGNIMPGHGGVMDRFDSALFVFPLLYLMVSTFPLLTVL